MVLSDAAYPPRTASSHRNSHGFHLLFPLPRMHTRGRASQQQAPEPDLEHIGAGAQTKILCSLGRSTAAFLFFSLTVVEFTQWETQWARRRERHTNSTFFVRKCRGHSICFVNLPATLFGFGENIENAKSVPVAFYPNVFRKSGTISEIFGDHPVI